MLLFSAPHCGSSRASRDFTRRSLFSRGRKRPYSSCALTKGQPVPSRCPLTARRRPDEVAVSTGSRTHRPAEASTRSRRSRVKISSVCYSQYRPLQDEHLGLLVFTQLIAPPTQQDRRATARSLLGGAGRAVCRVASRSRRRGFAFHRRDMGALKGAHRVIWSGEEHEDAVRSTRFTLRLCVFHA